MRAALSVLLGSLLVSWSGSVARAQPIGLEFLVNNITAGKQEQAAVAMDDGGGFVVVWTSTVPAGRGSTLGVFARRYDSSGAALGDAFQVHSSAASGQNHPAVAMDDAGDFVVVWVSFGQDGDGDGILARRFDSSGAPEDAEFRVNTTTPFAQNFPAVAMDADGDFVVAWQSYHDGSGVGVFVQQFDSAGAGVGGEFQVNTFTAGYQAYPSVAMDDAGDFVVAWDSDLQDGSADGVFAQRFDASGSPLGIEFPVNSFTTSDQATPSAAMDADGDFVIAWKSAGQDGSGSGIFAQRFNSSGGAEGDEFRVNRHTASDQTQPQAAMDDAGGFVVTWNSFGQDGSVGGIFGQLFEPSGAARGSEFRVNTTTYLDQAFPAAAMDADGDFVVAWQTSFQLGGDPGDIFAQRFGPAGGSLIVSIDIEPGHFPNKINPKSNEEVKVAILTTSVADGDELDFDAWDQVDPTTLAFGPLGAPAHGRPHAKDIDQDGDIDMEVHFHLGQAGIPCGATEATLTGETFDGMPFEGTDSVLTHGGGCKPGK